MQWITKGSKWTSYGRRFATSGKGNFVVELCILFPIWLANVVDRGGNLQIWKIYRESKRPFQRNIDVVPQPYSLWGFKIELGEPTIVSFHLDEVWVHHYMIIMSTSSWSNSPHLIFWSFQYWNIHIIIHYYIAFLLCIKLNLLFMISF